MSWQRQDASERPQHKAIQRYYRLQAGIYDATRWSFLWGRGALMAKLALLGSPNRILEVGCGTGKNLLHLGSLFPRAHLTGIDLSPDMLAVAARKLHNLGPRVTLQQTAYDRPATAGTGFDLVVFSYALSMFNPGWEEALAATGHDLSPGGILAVLDFHDSGLPFFRQWMALHHVRLDGHLLPYLRRSFVPREWAVKTAYAGLWTYFFFIGQNP